MRRTEEAAGTSDRRIKVSRTIDAPRRSVFEGWAEAPSSSRGISVFASSSSRPGRLSTGVVILR